MSKWPDSVPIPKPVKPDSIEQWEWDHYMNLPPRRMKPEIRDKVEKAMGWNQPDIADAQEIADKVMGAVDKIIGTPQPAPLIQRLRAALRLLENEHITPQGRRILEKILDEEERHG